MAVGRKGGFATVGQAPIVDFGAMVRNAQAIESQYQKDRTAFEVGYQEEKESILASKSELEIPEYEFNFGDELTGVALSQLQNDYYQISKQIEDARGKGEWTNLNKLKGELSAYNSKVSEFQNDLNYISSVDNELKKAVESGDFSDGVEGSTYKILEALERGNIKGVAYDKKEGFVYSVDIDGETQKVTLQGLKEMMQNPPKNIKKDDVVDNYGKVFKARVDEEVKSGFRSVEDTFMTDGQKNEIRDHVGKLVNSKEYTNSVIFNAFGIKGVYDYNELVEQANENPARFGLEEGQELTPELLKSITETKLSNDYIEAVENRMAVGKKEDVDYSTKQSAYEFSQEQKDKEGDEVVEDFSQRKVNPTEISMDLYYGNVVSPNVKRSGGEQKAVNASDIQNGETFRFSKIDGIELGEVQGYSNQRLDAYDNFKATSYTVTPNKELILVGTYIPLAKDVQKTGGGTKTQGKVKDRVKEVEPTRTATLEDDRRQIAIKVTKQDTDAYLRKIGYLKENQEEDKKTLAEQMLEAQNK